MADECLAWCSRAHQINDGDMDLTRRAHAILHVNKESTNGAELDRAMSSTLCPLIAIGRAVQHDVPFLHVFLGQDENSYVDLASTTAFMQALKGGWCEQWVDEGGATHWEWNNIDVGYAWRWSSETLKEVVIDRTRIVMERSVTINLSSELPGNLKERVVAWNRSWSEKSENDEDLVAELNMWINTKTAGIPEDTSRDEARS